MLAPIAVKVQVLPAHIGLPIAEAVTAGLGLTLTVKILLSRQVPFDPYKV